MKSNQKIKKSSQDYSLITPNPDATDFNSLLDYLNNHDEEIQSTLANNGVILIRGYQIKTPEQFQQVGLHFFPNLQNQYPGGAPRKKVAEYVWTASELASYLPISGHTELSYSPLHKPSYILFFGSQTAANGGETPVIDMKSIFSDLPEGLQYKCSQNRLVTKLFFTSTPKRFFDVRLWQWPWFSYTKTWTEVFNTNDPGLVELKCHEVGRKVEWLNNNDLNIYCPMEIISSHPITQEIVWTGWFPRFHIWGACIEAWFVANYQKNIRNYLLFLLLFIITLMQVCYEKLIPGQKKYRYLDVAFEDGSKLSIWDVYSIIKSYWKNAKIFSWQDGDVLILDNYRIGHGRLPFSGERKVYTAFA